MSFRFIYVFANARISFFIQVEYIPLYISTTFKKKFSSVNGHLGNYLSAKLWLMLQCTYKCRFFKIVILFSLDKYKEMELLDHIYASSIFHLLRNLHIVSIRAVPIHIPTNSVQRISLLHIIVNICYPFFFRWHVLTVVGW